MTAYVYQEFPKVKYHPKLGTKTVQNAEEEKALGNGWYNNPGEFPKPSRILTGLDQVVKPFWVKWKWIVGAIALLLTIVGTVVSLLRR
jgi:hypothetical protein